MNSSEIAKIAGVSRSTVSKVLNGYDDVCEETKKKVLKVVKKYNYAPDFSASVLAGKKIDTIGVFIAYDNHKPVNKQVHNSTFYSPFLTAIVDNAQANGQLIVVSSIGNNNDIDNFDRIFRERRIDSAIVLGGNDSIVEKIALTNHPAVIVSYDMHQLEHKNLLRDNLAFVAVNSYKGIAELTQKLIDAGYRRIGMITGGNKRTEFETRYKAFKDTMINAGLTINPKHIITSRFFSDSTPNEVSEFLEYDNIPEAIVCVNDDTAIDTISTLRANGYRVPRDIAVTGFDDIEQARYMRPALTTVRLPIHDMACSAVARALELSSGPRPCSNDIFDTKLIIRESAEI